MKMFNFLGMIAIIFSFLLVGAPIKFNCMILSLAIIALGIVLTIYKVYTGKKFYTCKKIDLVVVIFLIAPIIPLTFTTYYSLVETLILLLKNIAFFNVYYLIRESLGEDKRNKKYLIAGVIVGGYVLAILGIAERIGASVFNYYVDFFKIIITEKDPLNKRMPSIVGYQNAFAIIMAVDLLICLSNWKNHKILYSLLSLIFFVCFAWAFSRIAIIVFAFLLFIYIVFVKKIIKFRYVLFIGLLGFLILEIGFTFDRPLVLFQPGEKNNYVKRKVTENAEKCQKYTFVFDIEAESDNAKSENYIIIINERDLNGNILDSHAMKVDNMKCRKEMEIISSDSTEFIDVAFQSINVKLQKKLKINAFYVNGEKQSLSYVFLPDDIAEQLKNITLKNSSVTLREKYIADGIRIIKDHFLLGIGGKGWKNIYNDYQNEAYGTIETHSFLTDTFINTGIVGFGALIIILIYVFVKIIKKKENITLFDIAFLLLILHSWVDFDMSFYCIGILWIVLLGMRVSEDNEEKKVEFEKSENDEENKKEPCMQLIKIDNKMNKKTCLICIGVILLNFAGATTAVLAKNYQRHNNYLWAQIYNCTREENYCGTIDYIKEYHKYEKREEFNGLLMQIDYSKLDDSRMEDVYNDLKSRKVTAVTSFNIEKNNVLRRILRTCTNEEWLLKFADMVIENNDEVVANITDRSKNKLKQRYVIGFLEENQSLYDLALEIRGKSTNEQ